MMPTTSPRLHLEGDVLERPELLRLVAGYEQASAQHVGDGAQEPVCTARDDVPQRGVALALGLVVDQILLAEALGADDDVGRMHNPQSLQTKAPCGGNGRRKAKDRWWLH